MEEQLEISLLCKKLEDACNPPVEVKSKVIPFPKSKSNILQFPIRKK